MIHVKRRAGIFLGLVAVAAAVSPLRAQEGAGFDRIADALSWATADGQVRARVSGLLDLEGYAFDQPARGVVEAESGELFNPRLSLFLDAQVGEQVYFFAQARVDRGFDPADASLEARLDEYAIRFSPRRDGLVNFQVGKFGTVMGNWVSRHLSWENAFITAPAPYEYLTGIFDDEATNTVHALLIWSGVRPVSPATERAFKRQRVPIVWGPAYASGLAVSGARGKFDYAVDLKNSSVSSRPASWDVAAAQWQHPTVSGRVGFRPDARWYLGISGSAGSYLTDAAKVTLQPGRSLDDYRQLVWAHDVGFAWRHFQFWAEVYAARFEIPRIGPADTWAYYLEAKYKFTPRYSAALRWNEQRFGDVPDELGRPVRWGENLARIEAAQVFRFTAHTELKLQFSLQRGGVLARGYSRMNAAQFVMRF